MSDTFLTSSIARGSDETLPVVSMVFLRWRVRIVLYRGDC